MKSKLFLSIIIFTFIIVDNQFSSTFDHIYDKSIAVEVSEIGIPLLPMLSKVDVEIPFSNFFKDEFISGFDLNIWYLAYSRVFMPDVFFEVGVVFDLEIISKKNFGFEVGLGTAFSMTSDSISIPLILDTRLHFNPWRWSQFNLNLQYLQYGEGGGIDGKVSIDIMPFKFPIYLNIGYGALLLWDGINLYLQDQGSIGLGYIINLENRK